MECVGLVLEDEARGGMLRVRGRAFGGPLPSAYAVETPLRANKRCPSVAKDTAIWYHTPAPPTDARLGIATI